jgi:hypothetical protein
MGAKRLVSGLIKWPWVRQAHDLVPAKMPIGYWEIGGTRAGGDAPSFDGPLRHHGRGMLRRNGLGRADCRRAKRIGAISRCKISGLLDYVMRILTRRQEPARFNQRRFENGRCAVHSGIVHCSRWHHAAGVIFPGCQSRSNPRATGSTRAGVKPVSGSADLPHNRVCLHLR